MYSTMAIHIPFIRRRADTLSLSSEKLNGNGIICKSIHCKKGNTIKYQWTLYGINVYRNDSKK